MGTQFPLNDTANWPAIPDDLIRALQEWGRQPSHSTAWKSGMTGEDAVGSLAFIAGMGHIIGKLVAVRHAQQVRAEKANIATSLKGQ